MKQFLLCVDDEKIVLDSLLSQLRNSFKDRFQIETVQSSEEAWEVINEIEEQGNKVVLIISDWLMPITKGDEFLISIANKKPEIKLILLSGHAEEEAVERTKKYANLGFFIKKPWDRDDLIDKINVLLK